MPNIMRNTFSPSKEECWYRIAFPELWKCGITHALREIYNGHIKGSEVLLVRNLLNFIQVSPCPSTRPHSLPAQNGECWLRSLISWTCWCEPTPFLVSHTPKVVFLPMQSSWFSHVTHIVGAHFKKSVGLLNWCTNPLLFVTTRHAFAKQLAGFPGELESAAPVS